MLEVRDTPQREIVEFVSRSMLGQPNPSRFYGLGSYMDDKLIGAFVYRDYKYIGDGFFSMEMHMAGQPGWLSRQALKSYFAYPFEFGQCSRVIGPVFRANQRSADIAKRLGCTLDGIIRSGISPDRDLMIWTMTRDECRWLR